MSTDKIAAMDQVSAACKYNTQPADAMEIHGRYRLVCRDKDGNIKWDDIIDNTVMTVGKNEMLDKYLSGSAWTTGTVYMGLKSTGTPNAADTMALHSTWTELNITASSGARQAVTFAAAGSGSKATSSAVSFSVTAAGPTSVFGVFVVVGGSATNGNTSGTLFSAGDFSSSKSVVNGDTIAVTYTATLT